MGGGFSVDYPGLGAYRPYRVLVWQTPVRRNRQLAFRTHGNRPDPCRLPRDLYCVYRLWRARTPRYGRGGPVGISAFDAYFQAADPAFCADLSGLRIQADRDYADRCVSVLLGLPKMWRASAPVER